MSRKGWGIYLPGVQPLDSPHSAWWEKPSAVPNFAKILSFRNWAGSFPTLGWCRLGRQRRVWSKLVRGASLLPHCLSKPAPESFQLEAAQPRSSHSAWVPALAGRAGSALELVRLEAGVGLSRSPVPQRSARAGRAHGQQVEAARATYLKKSFLQ